MSYAPNNKTVYTAAFSGALAGIGASQKSPTDGSSTDPPVTGLANLAGSWAQEFDVLWGPNHANTLDVLAIESASEGVFTGNCPPNVPPFTSPTNWTVTINAIIAMVKAGEGYFASQGVTPDPWPAGGSGSTGSAGPTG